MGIYIKGMKMPKNCDMCIYSAWSNYFQIYVCDAARESEPVLFGGKQVNIIDIVRSGRADNCPLIEIPPHGRLIDADALTNRVGSYMPIKWTYEYGSVVSLNDIEHAPTIIGEEENKT